MNLYDLLAGRFPEDRARPAFLITDGAVVSYGRLETPVAQVAGRLAAEGVQPGDRVALQAEKRIAGVVIYLATL
jgi:malonyl-CoA/methylmalonyl-CoA synthetase